ncbi:MAG: transglutaminase domain-containing protein [Dehalococcoidia bacterium]|nr:transglutaminase domain-containing protein [Dehalococcoidia bacterium]
MSLRAMPVSAMEARIGAPQPYTAPPQGSLWSWETWISLGLVLLGFMAVTASIEQADWVPEMPSLTPASMLGLSIGFVIARLRGPGALWLLVALPLGAASTALQAMYAIQLSDPALGDGFYARADELVLRLQDWLMVLVTGDVSTDPIPFILIMVMLSWSMAFAASWAVFRLRNGWLAVVPGGVALLTNISYLPGQPSFAFIVYLFAGVLLVTRMHTVRADVRWRAEHVTRPPLLTLEVLNFATWAALALIVVAWSIPTANNFGPIADVWQQATVPVTDRLERVGRAFFGIDAKRVDLVHKFGDMLPLQGGVRLSGEQLMSVEAPPDVVYLRAAVYDEYTGRGWRVTGTTSVPLPGTSVEAASFGTPQTRAQFRRPFVATVQLKSASANRRLMVPGEPLAASVDASLVVGPDHADVIGLAPAERLRATGAYEAVGTVSGATASTLGKAPAEYPEWVIARYLQLPATLPAGVRELADSITHEASSPYLKARRIEQHLRTQYVFDLTAPDPPPRADAVGTFLLDNKRGYFDQYASAMVVMLRANGVPARLAVGFAMDPRDLDATTKAYVVSDRAAWAWPEVYISGLGWVDFNPTPTRPLIQRAQDDSEFQAAEDAALAGVAEETLSLLDDFEVDPFAGSAPATRLGDSGADILGRVAAIFATLATLLVASGIAAIVGGIGVRVWWEYRFRGMPADVARWSKLLDLAIWADVGPLSTRTPLEAARELRASTGVDADLVAIARTYTRRRYGRPMEPVANEDDLTPRAELDPPAPDLDGAYLATRNRLLRMTVARALPSRRAAQPSQSTIAIRS